jgi:tetratricopeptide (TPR) repeat protein
MLSLSNGNVDIRVLTAIGNCHRKLKTFDSGVPYFESALQKEPDNFYALFGLADCYRGMRHQERSLEYWNHILSTDARNKVILTRAGDAYRNMSSFDKAQEYYERALNIEFDIYAVLGLALIAKAKEKYEEAADSLRRLMQQDPKNYRLAIELSDCYLKNGEKRKAVETLEVFQNTGMKNNHVAELLEKIVY